jgi:O-antigen ligase
MLKNLNKYLIIIIILLAPTYLARFAILGIPTNALEILVLVAFLYYLTRDGHSFSGFYQKNKTIFWSIVAIFTGLLISTLANNNQTAGFGIIKGWFLVPIMFAWVVYESIETEQDLKNILKWLYFGIFGVAVVSLGYYFAGTLTYDGRLFGIYNSPNFLAMYVSPGIVIGLFLAQLQNVKCKNQDYDSKCKIQFLVYIIPLFIVVTVLYLTYSYAAWMAVASSLIATYLIKSKKNYKQTILISAIIVLLIFITQLNTEKFANLKKFSRSSIESRMMIWKSAGRILSDNIFLGIGPGNFQNKYLEYQKYYPPYLEWAIPQPHNLYLAFWLQAGILGLVGFLTLIVKWLKDLLNIVGQKNSSLSFIAAVLFGIVTYILIHGLFDTLYWKNDLALIFWIIFALGLVVVNRLKVDSI